MHKPADSSSDGIHTLEDLGVVHRKGAASRHLVIGDMKAGAASATQRPIRAAPGDD